MRIVFTIPPRSYQTLSTPRIFIRANPDFWYSPTIAFRSSFHSSSRYLPDPVTQRKIPRSRVVICPRNAFSLNPRFPEKRTSSTWLPGGPPPPPPGDPPSPPRRPRPTAGRPGGGGGGDQWKRGAFSREPGIERK